MNPPRGGSPDMQSDPYLAALEQRIAMVKMHALALVTLVDMVSTSTLPRRDRDALVADLREGIAIARKLAPAHTAILDDAIRKLNGVDGADARVRALESTRDAVRAALDNLHAFMGRPPIARPIPWIGIGIAGLLIVDVALRLWGMFS